MILANRNGFVRVVEVFATFLLLLALSVCSPGCKRSPEKQYSVAMEQGHALFTAGDYPGALAAFRTAENIFPKRPNAHFALAQTFMKLGWTGEASAAAIKTIHCDQHHAGAKLLLARLNIEMGTPDDVKRSREDLLEILKKAPSDNDALFLLAAADTRLGAPEEGRKVLEARVGAAPAPPVQFPVALSMVDILQRKLDSAELTLRQAADSRRPEWSQALIALGRLYLFQGRTADADRQFAAALARDPKNPEAILGQAAVQLRAGDWKKAEAIYRRLAGSPDRRYRYLLADFLSQFHRYDEAIAEYKRVWELDRGDRTARLALLRAYFGAGRVQEAGKIIAAVLKKNPREFDANLQAAELAIAAGALNEAAARLNTAVRLEPASPDVHYLLAKMHGARSAVGLQIQELEECLRLQPEFAEARIQLADALMSKGNPETALQVLRNVPAAQREDDRFDEPRAWALFFLGRAAEVAAILKDPKHASSTFLNGLVQLNGNDVNLTRSYFMRAFTSNPADFRPLEAVIETYLSRGDVNAARNVLTELFARVPDSAANKLFLGIFYLRTGDANGAREALQEAKTTNPQLIDADLGLAQIETGENNFRAARTRLAAILAKHPESVSALVMLASVEQRMGETESAMRDYRGVIGLDAHNTVALNNLAWLLASEGGSTAEAVTLAQQAKEASPEDPEVADTLGWVFYKSGVYKAAVDQFQQALGKDPANPSFLAHLGLAQSKMGDKDAARRSLTAALLRDPGVLKRMGEDVSTLPGFSFR